MSLQLPPFYRTPKFFIVTLGVACSLWLLLVSYQSYVRGSFVSLKNDVETNIVQRRQLVVRTTPTNRAGIGSVLAQLRSSAAIATILDADFATFGLQSEHPYRVASLLHLDLLEHPLTVESKVCSISALPTYSRVHNLVESWCNNPNADSEHAVELRESLKDCDLILDDRPWDVRQDMAKCTWKWVKQVFSKLGVNKQAGGVGIHIRWGDMASGGDSKDPKTPERSIPIEVAAKLLRKMRECGVDDELSVYMEAHNLTLLDGLGEPYRLVDTGNDINDLVDLASNRIMVLDIGSYTAIAHQISDGGVTVVPDVDEFGISWHNIGPNTVLRWNELLSISCSELSTLLRT
ncbi:hypothetical protein CPB83DRAFT_894556 [Crepidotus variabilis]|uniref:Uncharacterized protein n=1 Tax=Crepidotus variabilis TaxID=179855 RepID=A0A9P6EG56_9AGAR|nr:hypothetical protein CPB83DRAFT_894556 [Crepidotus variabilis]